MKILPVRAVLLHANVRTDKQLDGGTNRLDKAKSRLSKFCEGAQKANTHHPQQTGGRCKRYLPPYLHTIPIGNSETEQLFKTFLSSL
jgi:hypothetical protein